MRISYVSGASTANSFDPFGESEEKKRVGEGARFLVFGSVNIDEIFRVPHLPHPGETIQSKKVERMIGGKGANQAIALASAGARAFLAGKIGEDGLWGLDWIKARGVDVSRVLTEKAAATGKAVIMVADDGENSIVLDRGCNWIISEVEADAVLSGFGEGDWLVVQNEINCTPYVMRKAHDAGMRIAFNPSPFDKAFFEQGLFDLADLVIANEDEAGKIFCVSQGERLEDAAVRSIKGRPELVMVVTLGEKGSFCIAGGEIFRQDAVRVRVVDTTGAGDAFLGYFLASYAKFSDIGRALSCACVAAGEAVMHRGAADSIPIGFSV